MNKRTVVMVVLDGWGVGEKSNVNPIYIKNPRTINYIKHHYLSGVLQASGIAVGLPWDEEGNSEVGHLTLGSGRVIYQHYPRITLAIRNGKFFENKILLEAIKAAKDGGKAVNIVGILPEGNVHASFDHIVALLKLAKQQGLPKLNFQVFTDGKDSPTKSAAGLLGKLAKSAEEIGYDGLRIGSVSGRYYAMDRDKHLNRTARAFDTIVGQIPNYKSQITNKSQNPNNADVEAAIQYIEGQYEKGLTDEYVEPAAINPEATIKDGDSVIFFNFREDSIRQLTEMFLQNISENPKSEIRNSKQIQNPNEENEIASARHSNDIKNLHIVTFTNYNDNYHLPVAFPPENVTNPLGKILADSGKTQLRIAESNKYAHVTYFFNGFVETPFKNEYRILIPSQSVARYDEHPEMRAAEITTRAIEALSENIYDFILINYANADIVAHTGNFNATLQAVETVDTELAKLMDAVLKKDGVLVITADHGNAEVLIDAKTGVPETKHDISPVPLYIVGREFMREKDDFDVDQTEKESAGLLSDVAPTVLAIMGMPQPEEMTGISLLNILQ